MQAAPSPFRVSAASFFPAPVRPLIGPLEPAIERFLLPENLLWSIQTSELHDGAANFASRLLVDLDIRYDVAESDLNRIPASGGALIVANHPFGFLEGLILLPLFEKVRPDYRIVANSLLSSIESIREKLILVNPFDAPGLAAENRKGLREAVEWLASGGLLVMFPAGEVAHLNWGEQPVADPPWNAAAARLARKMNCPAIPVFFDGTNSVPFQVLGTIHPVLRTVNLLRELEKKRSQTIRLRIGTPVSADVLKEFSSAASATDYLRARTYLLRNRQANPTTARHAAASPATIRSERLGEEIAGLQPRHLLASNSDFAVYCARAHEIPNLLEEIGRCREITFRQIGEGTGNSLDLDRFDDYYEHLFLWSRRDQCIAGGYRVAATPDVLPGRGINGLYTSTLFRYDPAFFRSIGPALELGRSFVCREYQKHYAPLLLLWKGIARYAQQRPECPVLFGAVSISADYHAISRELIVNFLSGHVAPDLKRWIKPRRGFRTQSFLPKYVKRLGTLLSSVEELSASVSDLEQDGKGVPVLIRHYLKVGGQLLGFNVDPSFSNALDALILADLRTASPAMLERCMGRSGAAAFRAHHASGNALNYTRPVRPEQRITDC